MLDLNLDVLQECWTEQKKYLKDGLISGDIWDRNTGLSLMGFDANPEATALFNQLTGDLVDTLSGSGFPKFNRYYMVNLENDKLFIVIRHGDSLLQGMLLDPTKINMGILLTVAIPKAIAKVKESH